MSRNRFIVDHDAGVIRGAALMEIGVGSVTRDLVELYGTVGAVEKSRPLIAAGLAAEPGGPGAANELA